MSRPAGITYLHGWVQLAGPARAKGWHSTWPARTADVLTLRFGPPVLQQQSFELLSERPFPGGFLSVPFPPQPESNSAQKVFSQPHTRTYVEFDAMSKTEGQGARDEGQDLTSEGLRTA
jgi:hypothetical protein